MAQVDNKLLSQEWVRVEFPYGEQDGVKEDVLDEAKKLETD